MIPMNTKTITWHSSYNIVGSITIRHELDDFVCAGSQRMLWLSPSQSSKVRHHLGESGDYYTGLTLPPRGEGC